MTKLIRFFIVTQCLVFCFHEAYAVPYDYSFTSDCLAEPLSSQYGGGIVENSELNEGLKGWAAFGDAKIEHRTSLSGNKYVVASERKESFHSVAQTLPLKANMLYTFSAWIRVNQGTANVAAILSTANGNETVCWVSAQTECWSMLKGGLVVKTSSPAHLYFATNNTEVDIHVDSVSLQSFTPQEWKSHQQLSIKKFRQRRVRFQAVDEYGSPVPNATVSLFQTRHKFPLGCAINNYILNNAAYQSWFLRRFKYTVFENELKWYSTEPAQNVEDYSTADAMVHFARSHNISTRGHNVLWADPKYQPYWVNGLSPTDLWAATKKRVNSVVRRYAGDLIHWDIVNENLHFRFFEDKLGDPFVSAKIYDMAHRVDPRATPFLNDFNTIECSGDWASSPPQYLQKIKDFRAHGYRGRLAMGLEGHFSYLNLPSVRAALDILTQAKLPIWVTELDFVFGPDQASNLAQMMQELYSHDAVRGLMIWSALNTETDRCYVMCLTDTAFNNLDTGDVVDKFIDQLRHEGDHKEERTTDYAGFHEAWLHHGDYRVQMWHPDGVRSSDVGRVKVVRKSNGKRKITYRFTLRK